MTDTDYFDAHIPHRVNLLVAFRTRYSLKPSPHSLSPEAYRDLFRCAKDMCLLMTRYFSGELGFYFDEKTGQMENAQKWKSRFGTTRVELAKLRADPRYVDLCQMYRAANQSVAHINSEDVYHSFRVTQDDERIVAVIDWLELLIGEHIYRSAGRDLESSMRLPSNRMV